MINSQIRAELLPRIVFIQNRYADHGGVTTWIATVAAELIRRGYEIEIGAIHRAPAAETSSAYSGLTKTWALTPDTRVRSARAIGRNARKKLDEYADRETIIVFTQLFACEHFAPALQQLPESQQLRTIGQFHSSYAYAAKSGDHKRARKTYANFDIFTCLSASDAADFTRFGLHNVVAVDNPISATAAQEAAPLNTKIAVMLSRFDRVKRPEHAVAAWQQVIRTHPEWQLHIYGSGPLESEVREQIASLGLQSNVRIFAPVDDVAEVLQGASMLISSSEFEGLPLAVGEAALAGVPTVMYDCSPGVRELVLADKTGVLVPSGYVAGLAAAASALAADSRLRRRLGVNAREYVSERFAVAKVVDTWEHIFANVLR